MSGGPPARCASRLEGASNGHRLDGDRTRVGGRAHRRDTRGRVGVAHRAMVRAPVGDCATEVDETADWAYGVTVIEQVAVEAFRIAVI